MASKKNSAPAQKAHWRQLVDEFGTEGWEDPESEAPPDAPKEPAQAQESGGLSNAASAMATLGGSALGMSGLGQLAQLFGDSKGLAAFGSGAAKGVSHGFAPALQAAVESLTSDERGKFDIYRQQNQAKQSKDMAGSPKQAMLGEVLGSLVSPVAALTGGAGAAGKVPGLLRLLGGNIAQGAATGAGDAYSRTGDASEAAMGAAKGGALSGALSALPPALLAGAKGTAKFMTPAFENSVIRALGANKKFTRGLDNYGPGARGELADDIVKSQVAGKYGFAPRDEIGQNIVNLERSREGALSEALGAVPGTVDPKTLVSKLRRQATLSGQGQSPSGGNERLDYITGLRGMADEVKGMAQRYKAPAVASASKTSRAAAAEQTKALANKQARELAEYVAEMRSQAFKKAPKGEKVTQREMADSLARESFSTISAAERKALESELAAAALEAEKQASQMTLREANDALKRPLTGAKVRSDASLSEPGVNLRAASDAYDSAREWINANAEKMAGPEASQAIRAANKAKARVIQMGEAAWEARNRAGANKDFGLSEQNLATALSAATGSMGGVPAGMLAGAGSRFLQMPASIAALKASRGLAAGAGSQNTANMSKLIARTSNPLKEYFDLSGYSSVPETELQPEELEQLQKVKGAVKAGM